MTSPEPGPLPPTPGQRPLRRCPEHRLVAGVAAGIGEYLDIDPLLVRLAVVALALTGIGAPLYLAAWVLMPAAGADTSIADTVAQRFRAA